MTAKSKIFAKDLVKKLAFKGLHSVKGNMVGIGQKINTSQAFFRETFAEFSFHQTLIWMHNLDKTMSITLQKLHKPLPPTPAPQK